MNQFHNRIYRKPISVKYSELIIADLTNIVRKNKWPEKFTKKMKLVLLEKLMVYHNENEDYRESQKIKEAADQIINGE